MPHEATDGVPLSWVWSHKRMCSVFDAPVAGECSVSSNRGTVVSGDRIFCGQALRNEPEDGNSALCGRIGGDFGRVCLPHGDAVSGGGTACIF